MSCHFVESAGEISEGYLEVHHAESATARHLFDRTPLVFFNQEALRTFDNTQNHHFGENAAHEEQFVAS